MSDTACTARERRRTMCRDSREPSMSACSTLSAKRLADGRCVATYTRDVAPRPMSVPSSKSSSRKLLTSPCESGDCVMPCAPTTKFSLAKEPVSDSEKEVEQLAATDTSHCKPPGRFGIGAGLADA